MNSNNSKKRKHEHDADDQIPLDNTANSTNENHLGMEDTSNSCDDESVSSELDESLVTTLTYNKVESCNIGSLVCCVPECYKSNKYDKEEMTMKNSEDSANRIILYSPTNDVIKDWSHALGVPLTLRSLLCEKHFKMEDVVHIKSDEGNLEDVLILPGVMPILQPNPHTSKRHSIDGPQRTTKSDSLECLNIEPVNKIPITSTDDSNDSDDSDDSVCMAMELNHENVATTSSTSFMSETMQSSCKQSEEESEKTLDISDPMFSIENLTFEPISPTKSKNKQLNCIFNQDSSGNININLCSGANLTKDKDIIFKDLNSILKICKSIRVPSIFWKCLIETNLNNLLYVELGPCIGIIKKVLFHSNLVPKICINKKQYKYNTPVKTKHELEDLLEKISDIEICMGYDNFVHDKCLGYFESTSEETEVCNPCRAFTKKCKSKMKIELRQKLDKIKTLEKSIAIKEVRVKRIREMFSKND